MCRCVYLKTNYILGVSVLVALCIEFASVNNQMQPIKFPSSISCLYYILTAIWAQNAIYLSWPKIINGYLNAFPKTNINYLLNV